MIINLPCFIVTEHLIYLQGNTPRVQAVKADDKELATYLESKLTIQLYTHVPLIFAHYVMMMDQLLEYRFID